VYESTLTPVNFYYNFIYTVTQDDNNNPFKDVDQSQKIS